MGAGHVNDDGTHQLCPGCGALWGEFHEPECTNHQSPWPTAPARVDAYVDAVVTEMSRNERDKSVTPQTVGLTLVLQRVVTQPEVSSYEFAHALIEYAHDCLRDEGGRGQFERHITANRTRIEAIASIAPEPAAVAREGLATVDSLDAVRQRLETAREMADYLPGGESIGQTADLAGYGPAQAATEIRSQLDEAIQALPESRVPDSKL